MEKQRIKMSVNDFVGKTFDCEVPGDYYNQRKQIKNFTVEKITKTKHNIYLSGEYDHEGGRKQADISFGWIRKISGLHTQDDVIVKPTVESLHRPKPKLKFNTGRLMVDWSNVVFR